MKHFLSSDVILHSFTVLVSTQLTQSRAVAKNEVDSCNPGFDYCSSLSMCYPSMCRLRTDDGGCPAGFLSCDQHSCIQNQCLSLVLSRSRPTVDHNDDGVDQNLVRKKRKMFPFEEMEDEYVWRRKRQVDVKNDKDKSRSKDKGKEKPRGKGDGDEDDDDPDDYLFCPAGTVYCLEMNECSRDCGAKDKFDNLEFDVEEDGDNDGDDDEDDDGDYISCPPGTTFCMSEMQCMANCGLGGMDDDDFDNLFDDDDASDDDEGMECPAGQVFCMQVMACVSNCGFFKEDTISDGEEASDNGDEMTCPPGHVYCMSRDKCVPSSVSCDDEHDHDDTDHGPPGDLCPVSEHIISVGQSTCQLQSHCPDNTSCCSDNQVQINQYIQHLINH